MIFKIIFLLVLFVTFQFCKPKKKDDNNNNLLMGAILLSNKTPKDKAIDEYNSKYLGTTVVNSGWTGSVTGCNPGSTSKEANDKTLARINYFRAQVGLTAVNFDSNTDIYTQSAALMMKANNTLDHNPPNTWTCYTSAGATGAAKSNLAGVAKGMHSSPAITVYMQDEGTWNYAVGHRRWILYSKLLTIGSGNTDTTNALWVVGDFASSYPSNMPEFIAWPPKGFVMRQLVFPRWSFSVPDANFINATITMQAPDGSAVSLTKETYAVGYGDNTVVWVPTGINTSSTQDQKYKVNIGNVVVGAETKSYSYEVEIIDPGENGPATTVPNIDWSSNAFIIPNQVEGQKFIYNCPPGGNPDVVFGVDIYATNSSVCTAAVHAGKISLSVGGTVTFIIRKSLTNYSGSTRNGITSYDLSSWIYGSFVFQ